MHKRNFVLPAALSAAYGLERKLKEACSLERVKHVAQDGLARVGVLKIVQLHQNLADAKRRPVRQLQDIPLGALNIKLEHVKMRMAKLVHDGAQRFARVSAAVCAEGAARAAQPVLVESVLRQRHGGGIKDVYLAVRLQSPDVALEYVVSSRANRVHHARPGRGYLCNAACPFAAVKLVWLAHQVAAGECERALVDRRQKRNARRRVQRCGREALLFARKRSTHERVPGLDPHSGRL